MAVARHSLQKDLRSIPFAHREPLGNYSKPEFVRGIGQVGAEEVIWDAGVILTAWFTTLSCDHHCLSPI